MVDKKILNSMFVSIATMLVMSTFEKFVNHIILPISIAMMVVGIFIVFFGPVLWGTNFLKKVLSKSIGLFLFTAGIGTLIYENVESFWTSYIIVGLLLFVFHDEMVELL